MLGTDETVLHDNLARWLEHDREAKIPVDAVCTIYRCNLIVHLNRGVLYRTGMSSYAFASARFVTLDLIRLLMDRRAHFNSIEEACDTFKCFMAANYDYHDLEKFTQLVAKTPELQLILWDYYFVPSSLVVTQDSGLHIRLGNTRGYPFCFTNEGTFQPCYILHAPETAPFQPKLLPSDATSRIGRNFDRFGRYSSYSRYFPPISFKTTEK